MLQSSVSVYACCTNFKQGEFYVSSLLETKEQSGFISCKILNKKSDMHFNIIMEILKILSKNEMQQLTFKSFPLVLLRQKPNGFMECF